MIFFILAATASCAHRDCSIPQLRLDLDGVSVRAEITEVPFHPQESHQCGPAALATVLTWSGSQVTTEEISGEIYTPAKKGSLQPMLISGARQHNHLAYVIRDFNALIHEVAAGHPVIVLQNLGLRWFPRWHYAVVIGYHTQKQLVILRSGKAFRREIPWPLFCRTWERAGKWGLLVLPLDELPVSADEKSYLEAVLSLEEVGKQEEASIAYETALKRWPGSLGATMGLGNSLYAMGRLHEAEEAFRSAIELCSTCGDVYNNLAHVLAEQRRYGEAADAARKAIRLGGSNESTYNETLEEIRGLREEDG